MSEREDYYDDDAGVGYEVARYGDDQFVMRRMGYNRTHLVEVPVEWLMSTTWIGPAYWAFHGEAAARCGAVLRPDHRGLVAMKAGTPVTCPTCKHLAIFESPRGTE